jgi:hypothetical protein
MKIFFIGIMFWSYLFAADFTQAVESYTKGNYIQAFNIFYTLAKEDDEKAQYNVGLMYAQGLGVQKDMSKAVKWYEKSATQGNAFAQYNLAQYYHYQGSTDTHAYAKAKYWYEKCVKNEVKESYNNLGALYLEGLGVPKDEVKAFELFKQGADKLDASASINVALLYAWGKHVSHDKMKAYDYLKTALKQGRIEAEAYLDTLCKESAWVCKN